MQLDENFSQMYESSCISIALPLEVEILGIQTRSRK